jgi:hypothetical protein
MRQLLELEQILRTMVSEHRKLLAHLDAQQAALRGFRLEQIEEITALQEANRLRIATLETRRRTLCEQIGRLMRMDKEPSLSNLIELFPQRSSQLTALRDELREVVSQVQSRSTISGRVAGAVLGHLNTVVRLLAGAVEQAGVYTKHGIPKVAPRIGAMEAVG